jgi:hypothetical protein
VLVEVLSNIMDPSPSCHEHLPGELNAVARVHFFRHFMQWILRFPPARRILRPADAAAPVIAITPLDRVRPVAVAALHVDATLRRTW